MLNEFIHFTYTLCVFQCQPTALLCAIHARWLDGVKCGLFSNHAPLGRSHYVWDEYLYSVLEKVEVRLTVSVTVCVV